MQIRVEPSQAERGRGKDCRSDRRFPLGIFQKMQRFTWEMPESLVETLAAKLSLPAFKMACLFFFKLFLFFPFLFPKQPRQEQAESPRRAVRPGGSRRMLVGLKIPAAFWGGFGVGRAAPPFPPALLRGGCSGDSGQRNFPAYPVPGARPCPSRAGGEGSGSARACPGAVSHGMVKHSPALLSCRMETEPGLPRSLGRHQAGALPLQNLLPGQTPAQKCPGCERFASRCGDTGLWGGTWAPPRLREHPGGGLPRPAQAGM